MGEFLRDRLPDPLGYFEAQDVHLVGRGRWKTGPCHFHGGSDSLRINVGSGGWRCMACGAKGGDVLAYHMQRHGLGFAEAARDLGAYLDGGKPRAGTTSPSVLPAREAMQLVAHELRVAFVVIADIRAGVIPSDDDWKRFVIGAGRLEVLAQEYPS